MRKLTVTLFVILMVSVCFGTTVYLRKGGTIEGEIISKDDEQFVIKTAEGEKTIKWRQVKNKSIKEIYPELYEALKAQAIEKKKQKEVKLKKEEKKESDFSRIHLKVETNEKSSSYKKLDLDFDLDKYKSNVKKLIKSMKFYKKECNGIINIKIQDLDPKKKYVLKTIYSHYIKYDGETYAFIKGTSSEKNIVKKSNLSGKNNYDIEIISSPYYMYKEKLTGNYHYTKGSKKKKEYGDESDGWDVSIWLDDTLIYEKKKGKFPVYYKIANSII